MSLVLKYCCFYFGTLKNSHIFCRSGTTLSTSARSESVSKKEIGDSPQLGKPKEDGQTSENSALESNIAPLESDSAAQKSGKSVPEVEVTLEQAGKAMEQEVDGPEPRISGESVGKEIAPKDRQVTLFMMIM